MRTVHRDIVSALIISSDEYVLFGKKHPHKGGVYADKWHIPGGGIEDGETAEQALWRELGEEVNLKESKEFIVQLCDDLGTAVTDKILSTGEKVKCEMHFLVYKIKLPIPHNQVKVQPGDDFVQIEWVLLTQVGEYALTPPSITLFSRLGYLTEQQVEQLVH